MAVKQLPTLSPIPEPPNRLVGDQERFDTMAFNSLKAQEKMVNEDLNKALIPKLNQFAVDVNASVDAAKASETSALASKNGAASSATTATTKAGEAAASATAAKASETSALASKNAAGISATAAANAQNAAEAARDEAQDLANVGYASESHAGLAKVDGETTQADAGGIITVKDVAIGGDSSDLASARGQIGDANTVMAPDYNQLIVSGNYYCVQGDSVNGPPTPAHYMLFVDSRDVSGTVTGSQIAFRLASSVAANVLWIRSFHRASPTSETVFSPWQPRGPLYGDGIAVNNGTISVPEYEGATVSSAGTSGLVPPATAGQQESFLTGGGEYKPALTKISDSVSLADSATAASAKAVKTAYDLANGKQANLGFTPVQQGGGANQLTNKVRLGWDGGAVRMQVDDWDMGKIVTTDAGQTKAPQAASADVAGKAQTVAVTDDGQPAKFNWIARTGQPEAVWGGNPAEFGNMYVWNPARFGVNYATNASNAWQTTLVPNVIAGDNSYIPAGGTWVYFSYANAQVAYGAVAGGTYISGRHIAIRNA